MDWNDVRHFLALARTGSVRGAGGTLGVSHSTVARRVEALEERLRARLFDRSRDGYSLTDAGRQMLPRAERIEEEMLALERGVIGQDMRLAGKVMITCTDRFVSELLVGPLGAFCAEHPEIDLSMTAEERYLDLAKREADIAIRAKATTAQPQPFLLGQRVAPIVLATYVGVDHVERLDPEREGTEARWLGFLDPAIQRRIIEVSRYPALPVWGGFGSMDVMIQAARNGLGLAMLPAYVGDQEPRLRRIEHTDLIHVADLWMVSHPDLRTNARVRATRQLISAALAEQSDLFYGRRPTDGTACPEITPLGL